MKIPWLPKINLNRAQEYAGATRRWKFDKENPVAATSRPLVLLTLTALFVVFVVKESSDPAWKTPQDLRELFMVLYPGVVAAYFAIRTIEKRF